MPKFLVSVIGMGRPEGTRKCLEALFSNRNNAHIVLTSNGCAQTSKLFDEFAQNPDVTVFHETKNTFFQYPHNRSYQLAKKMGCEFLVLLNDDLVLQCDALPRLADVLVNDKSALSGVSGSCQQLNDEFHGCPGDQLHYIDGALLCLKISALDKYRKNLWCEGLYRIYSEDSSLSLYLQEKVYTIHAVHIPHEHVRCSTVNRDEETRKLCHEAQHSNHEVTKRRFAWWKQHRNFKQPIIIKRRFAMGDVLLISPIIDAIHQARPQSPIYIESDFPEIHQRNPFVTESSRQIRSMDGAIVIDLEMASEDRPNMHLIEAYAEVAREQISDIQVELVSRYYPDQEAWMWADYIWREKLASAGKMAILHMTSHWPGKQWPHERFAEICTWLVSKGYHVASVGEPKPHQIHDCIDLSGQTSIDLLSGLMKRASIFIGVDSFPSNLAQSLGVKTVVIFGCSAGKYILTNLGPRIGVSSNHPDSGIRHKLCGETYTDRGKEAIEAISVEQVKHAIEVIECQK